MKTPDVSNENILNQQKNFKMKYNHINVIDYGEDKQHKGYRMVFIQLSGEQDSQFVYRAVNSHKKMLTVLKQVYDKLRGEPIAQLLATVIIQAEGK